MAKNHQVAALPWRKTGNGIEILLVTTRTTKRWVVPKGWTMDGKADHEAAAIEAFEEAGVCGTVEAEPLGNYGYSKLLNNGSARHVKVRVFALVVDKVLEDWPEKAERQRQWVQLPQAFVLIGELELLPIIATFAKREGVLTKLVKTETSIIARFLSWWRSYF
jgi:8-oxo-dGTP pyrophosphatase MutT (NUDIX family)